MTAASMISQRKFQSDYQRKIAYMYEKSTENKTCYLFNEKNYRISIIFGTIYCFLYAKKYEKQELLFI